MPLRRSVPLPALPEFPQKPRSARFQHVVRKDGSARGQQLTMLQDAQVLVWQNGMEVTKLSNLW